MKKVGNKSDSYIYKHVKLVKKIELLKKSLINADNFLKDLDLLKSYDGKSYDDLFKQDKEKAVEFYYSITRIKRTLSEEGFDLSEIDDWLEYAHNIRMEEYYKNRHFKNTSQLKNFSNKNSHSKTTSQLKKFSNI